jgi:hypothetical protein
MTPKDIKEMEAARVAFHAAIDALDKAFKIGRPEAEVQQAIETIEERKVAWMAFGKKFFQRFPG